MKNNISRFIKAGAGWWGMSLLWMKKMAGRSLI